MTGTMTIERAAEILECSPETVVERIEAGDIAAEKFGRSWIIVESAFWDNLSTLQAML